MYRIAVLAEQEAERQRYAEQITRFCEAKGLFPQVRKVWLRRESWLVELVTIT